MNLPGFIQQKILGQGTYGCVYKAKRISDGQSYAVKVVNLQTLNHREIEDSVNEIRLMASFTSPYIIRFFEAFVDNRRLCIVTEYSRLGDLAHLIERRKKKQRPLNEEDIWRFLIQILEGLKVLHNCGVVHRDLKSANILLSAPDLIKIADLGVSTVLHTTQLARTQIGTPLYLAPEVWRRKPYDSKCDMWSLGVLLYEMMTFTFPFIANNTRDLAQKVCLGKFNLPKNYSKDLVLIVRRLLQVSPISRPSVDELLELQCIKSRMWLIASSIVEDSEIEIEDKLLSTIKVPQNIRNVSLPGATYGKKGQIIKPIEQRLHMKKLTGISKEIALVSSPELQMITDFDLWSPNKIQIENENDIMWQRPFSQRPVCLPPQPPKPPAQPSQIAPRKNFRNMEPPINPRRKRIR